jgi:hypothetical protein
VSKYSSICKQIYVFNCFLYLFKYLFVFPFCTRKSALPHVFRLNLQTFVLDLSLLNHWYLIRAIPTYSFIPVYHPEICDIQTPTLLYSYREILSEIPHFCESLHYFLVLKQEISLVLLIIFKVIFLYYHRVYFSLTLKYG